MEEINKILGQINDRVDRIEKAVERLRKRPDMLINEEWMDGKDVMRALHICSRTLQTLRDSGKLIPARIMGKYYYKAADVKALLEENYIRNHLTKAHD